MTGFSILYSDGRQGDRPRGEGAPDYFIDLNLGPVVSGILAGRETYDLTRFFYDCPVAAEDVTRRQDVMRDLEQDALCAAVRTFSIAMASVREHLSTAERMRHRMQKARWHLDAATLYCAAVRALGEQLWDQPLSVALRDMGTRLSHYVTSADFQRLATDAELVQDALGTVRYALSIHGGRVDLPPFEEQADYSDVIEHLFERFQQGDATDYPFGSTEMLEMNHIEEQILDLVIAQQSGPFALLGQFVVDHPAFVDPLVRRFDREVQFFLAYIDYIAPLRSAGLPFCQPRMETGKAILATDSFDIALAKTLARKNKRPVGNDLHLEGDERIIVVSGPNQGGKTTFARMFGQLHYLGALGLPVPGSDARLFLFDRIFTHFERGENTTDLRGKLEDDLIRIHEILEGATDRSLVIMNEIFTSTTLEDALELSRLVLGRLRAIDALGLWVTFVEEVASGRGIVSMVSTVDPDKPSERTFRILRAPATGMSDAIAIARRHGLTHELLAERLRA
ncbi:MutS-related protein [Sphingomonas oryzagri]